MEWCGRLGTTSGSSWPEDKEPGTGCLEAGPGLLRSIGEFELYLKDFWELQKHLSQGRTGLAGGRGLAERGQGLESPVGKVWQ